MNTFSKIKK